MDETGQPGGATPGINGNGRTEHIEYNRPNGSWSGSNHRWSGAGTVPDPAFEPILPSWRHSADPLSPLYLPAGSLPAGALPPNGHNGLSGGHRDLLSPLPPPGTAPLVSTPPANGTASAGSLAMAGSATPPGDGTSGNGHRPAHVQPRVEDGPDDPAPPRYGPAGVGHPDLGHLEEAPASAPPYPYEGDLEDAAAQAAGLARLRLPIERPAPPAGGREATGPAGESVRHRALDDTPPRGTPLAGPPVWREAAQAAPPAEQPAGQAPGYDPAPEQPGYPAPYEPPQYQPPQHEQYERHRYEPESHEPPGYAGPRYQPSGYWPQSYEPQPPGYELPPGYSAYPRPLAAVPAPAAPAVPAPAVPVVPAPAAPPLPPVGPPPSGSPSSGSPSSSGASSPGSAPFGASSSRSSAEPPAPGTVPAESAVSEPFSAGRPWSGPPSSGLPGTGRPAAGVAGGFAGPFGAASLAPLAAPAASFAGTPGQSGELRTDPSLPEALPQRVPAEPDVPTVPEPQADEPPAEAPELARIWSHLRRGDVRPRPEGFDIGAVLTAVRGVSGVRDAALSTTETGGHNLRLELADGTDAAQVSRVVVRLLQERLGLSASPRSASSGAAPASPGGMPASPGGMPPSSEGIPASPGGNPAPAGGPAGSGAPTRTGAFTDASTGTGAGGAPAAGGAGPGRTAGEDAADVPDAGRESRRRAPGRASGVIRGRAQVETASSGATGTAGATATGQPPAGTAYLDPGLPYLPGLVAQQPAPSTGPARQPAESAAPSRPLRPIQLPGPRVLIQQVQVSTQGLDATVEVRLAAGQRLAAGLSSGPAVDSYLLRLAADAAVKAVNQLLRAGTASGEDRGQCYVEHAAVVSLGSCEVAVVVVFLSTGGWVEQLAGSALVAGDARQAVVRATLAAMNRRLEGMLA